MAVDNKKVMRAPHLLPLDMNIVVPSHFRFILLLYT